MLRLPTARPRRGSLHRLPDSGLQLPGRCRATVEVVNTLPHDRPFETVSISATPNSRARWGSTTSGRSTCGTRRRPLTSSPRRSTANDDGTFDELIFQADVEPERNADASRSAWGSDGSRERRSSAPTAGSTASGVTTSPGKTICVAHRMYGAALETWAQEPLTSSGLDVWVKRTRRLVINDWYMVDDYHRDTRGRRRPVLRGTHARLRRQRSLARRQALRRRPTSGTRASWPTARCG